MKKESLSSTIERILSLLELFIQHPDGLSPQEILEKSSISRSSLFTLLKELKDIGYLDQAETRGRYIAGPRLLSLTGSNTPSYQSLINVFQEENQSKSLNETIALAVPSSQGILLLDQKQGSQIIRAVYSIGEPLMQESAANQILTTPYPEDVIRTGYHIHENNDFLEIAVPICADGFKPVAGLLLSVPKYRWIKEKLINEWLDELRAIAARISYRLGALQYSPYHHEVQSSFQPTTTMGDGQIKQFLAGPWTARLACIRPDGNPHVIPVWQEYDGERFNILALKGSQWAEYVRKNPQVSITIDEPWSPYRRVVSRGTAIESKELFSATQNNLFARLSQRYLGQQSSQPLSQQVEAIFIIQPDSLRGWMGLSNEKK